MNTKSFRYNNKRLVANSKNKIKGHTKQRNKPTNKKCVQYSNSITNVLNDERCNHASWCNRTWWRPRNISNRRMNIVIDHLYDMWHNNRINHHQLFFLFIVHRLFGRCSLRWNNFFDLFVFQFHLSSFFLSKSSGENGPPCKRHQIVRTSFMASENLFPLFSQHNLT